MLTANSRQVVEDQVKSARNRMLLCKVLCTVLFVVAGYLVFLLAGTAHAALILLLIFAVSVVIAAIGHVYSTAEKVLSDSTNSLRFFDRIENLR